MSTSAPAPARAVSGLAFLTLLLIALLMGANHVAARLAFDHGVDVATAVTVRSGATALVVGALIALQGPPRGPLTPRQRRALPAIGLLVALQSLCLYSAVARLPVALALLAFNTYPLATALWAWALYGQRPAPALLRAAPLLLLGLGLALDVLGAASGLGAGGPVARHRRGRGLCAGRVGGVRAGAGHHPPRGGRAGRARAHLLHHGHRGRAGGGRRGLAGRLSLAGGGARLVGLALLTVLYGTGITILFTALPRLGVVGNSAVMNVEPVFALGLAWAVLGQRIAPIQLLGAALVVGTVIWLGLRRR